MLTIGWSDGNTFLPVSCCLLSTENAKNRINEASKAIDARTNGGRQRKLAQRKGTDVHSLHAAGCGTAAKDRSAHHR